VSLWKPSKALIARCNSAAPEHGRLALFGNGSGEVAADRLLDVQRFALPLGLFTPAQPRLGRRPPSTAVLTDEHDSISRLHDLAEGPQISAQRPVANAWVQFLLELGAVGVRQGRTDQRTRSGRSGRIAHSATRTPHLLTGRTGRPLSLGDQACSHDLACQSWATARQAQRERPAVRYADGLRGSKLNRAPTRPETGRPTRPPAATSRAQHRRG
jgi:hypothetical protein